MTCTRRAVMILLYHTEVLEGVDNIVGIMLCNTYLYFTSKTVGGRYLLRRGYYFEPQRVSDYQ